MVSSWWAVEDRASRRFMELFYEGLRKGLDRDVAAQFARGAMAAEGFSHRDRLAFAVVGAVSGSLADVLGSKETSRVTTGIVMTVLAVVVVLGLLWYLRRRRSFWRLPGLGALWETW